MAKKKAAKKTEEQKGRFAYEGLDRILHEKARLGIMTCLLSKPEGLIFKDIKSLCDLTDGNLSRHLQSSTKPVWSKSGKDFRTRDLKRSAA